MGILTSGMRKALPASSFAGTDRSYPVPDASHAANAKARATQQVKAGNLSPSSAAKIDAKANAVLDSHPNRHKNLGKFLHPKKGG